jgi:hypothetical protein
MSALAAVVAEWNQGPPPFAASDQSCSRMGAGAGPLKNRRTMGSNSLSGSVGKSGSKEF